MNWYENTVRRYNPRELLPSDACVDMLCYFEGFRAEAYQDSVGVWTSGYGSTRGVKEGDVVTEQEARERMLQELTDDYSYDVQRLVSVPLAQYEFDALSSWTYNLGSGDLASSTLLKKLNKGDYEGAAKEILRWDRAGGQVLLGLSRRRASEMLMFQGKDWKDYKEISG